MTNNYEKKINETTIISVQKLLDDQKQEIIDMIEGIDVIEGGNASGSLVKAQILNKLKADK